MNTLHGAYLVAGPESLRISSKRPMAHVLDRRKLAKSCERAARKAGASINLGRKSGRRNSWILVLDKSTVLIGADGAVSQVASAFGFPPIRDHVLTYKAEFKCHEIDDAGMVGLYFSRSFAKGLFGWHVPYSNGTVELGLGIDHRARTPSSSAFNLFAKK